MAQENKRFDATYILKKKEENDKRAFTVHSSTNIGSQPAFSLNDRDHF